ncbi:MAG: c(7)-type cytochrome triheme domain-containing protein [Syntrophobacteria bacterium]
MSVKDKIRIMKVSILFFVLFLLASCSWRQGLALFFDLPEKSPEDAKVVSREKKRPPVKKAAEVQEQIRPIKEKEERPPIEKTLVWKESEKLLPKDGLGEVDWMEALRKGIIKPESSAEGAGDHFVFKFNFHFSGPPGLLGAYFPHSVHTQWLTCESCHPVIFPQRGTQLSMAKILSGEYCGKCHTKVAFPIAKGCKRCHVKKF